MAERRTLESWLAHIESSIAAPNDAARNAARAQWNAIAKPIRGLGALEMMVEDIAALCGSPTVSIDKRAVIVFCADNGVVAQGVSQCGSEVTAIVARGIAQGISSICQMARTMNVDAFAVDMGMAEPADTPGIIERRVAAGTCDISCGPALTSQQARAAVQTGIDLARDFKEQGYSILAVGEMGIGNTTTGSALAAALLGMSVEDATGRGAGLSDAGLQRKRASIVRALEVNTPDPSKPLEVLAKLGGFDIAGMVGLFIGGALYRIPVIIDGFISAIAADIAVKLVPACRCALLASHLSSEPAAKAVMDDLGLRPIIQADMHLGEGAGAICLLPLLDAALALYRGATFSDIGVDAYEENPQ